MLRELKDNIKQNNIHITGLLEVEEEEQGTDNLFGKVMTENFPHWMIEKNHTSPESTEGSQSR